MKWQTKPNSINKCSRKNLCFAELKSILTMSKQNTLVKRSRASFRSPKKITISYRRNNYLPWIIPCFLLDRCISSIRHSLLYSKWFYVDQNKHAISCTSWRQVSLLCSNYISMSAFLCHLTVTGQSWTRILIRYLLKMYFCLASQNRRGLWAAIKVSNEVNAVWDGRILSVTTLFEVECFHSGETQVVRGAKLFLFPPCAMNKLWS